MYILLLCKPTNTYAHKRIVDDIVDYADSNNQEECIIVEDRSLASVLDFGIGLFYLNEAIYSYKVDEIDFSKVICIYESSYAWKDVEDGTLFGGFISVKNWGLGLYGYKKIFDDIGGMKYKVTGDVLNYNKDFVRAQSIGVYSPGELILDYAKKLTLIGT